MTKRMICLAAIGFLCNAATVNAEYPRTKLGGVSLNIRSFGDFRLEKDESRSTVELTKKSLPKDAVLLGVFDDAKGDSDKVVTVFAATFYLTHSRTFREFEKMKQDAKDRVLADFYSDNTRRYNENAKQAIAEYISELNQQQLKVDFSRPKGLPRFSEDWNYLCFPMLFRVTVESSKMKIGSPFVQCTAMVLLRGKVLMIQLAQGVLGEGSVDDVCARCELFVCQFIAENR